MCVGVVLTLPDKYYCHCRNFSLEQKSSGWYRHFSFKVQHTYIHTRFYFRQLSIESKQA